MRRLDSIRAHQYIMQYISTYISIYVLISGLQGFPNYISLGRKKILWMQKMIAQIGCVYVCYAPIHA